MGTKAGKREEERGGEVILKLDSLCVRIVSLALGATPARPGLCAQIAVE